MDLLIDPGGQINCVYDEAIDLKSIGTIAIQRASHVEPTDDGQWTADLSPVHGPILGPFSFRTDALIAERQWLDCHWLSSHS